MPASNQTSKRVSTGGSSPVDKLAHIDWLKLTGGTLFLMTRPLIELGYAVRKGSLPWGSCLAIGAASGLFVVTREDLVLAQKLNCGALYPYRPLPYSIYCFVALTSGFWGWALRETWLRTRLVDRLSTVFQDAGLRSALGNLPKFISDHPVDAYTRKMSLFRSGLPKVQFEKAKLALESALQVYEGSRVITAINGAIHTTAHGAGKANRREAFVRHRMVVRRIRQIPLARLKVLLNLGFLSYREDDYFGLRNTPSSLARGCLSSLGRHQSHACAAPTITVPGRAPRLAQSSRRFIRSRGLNSGDDSSIASDLSESIFPSLQLRSLQLTRLPGVAAP